MQTLSTFIVLAQTIGSCIVVVVLLLGLDRLAACGAHIRCALVQLSHAPPPLLPLLRAHANPQLLIGDSMGRIEIFQSFVLHHANLLVQQCHLSRVLELEIIVVAKAYAARQARSWVACCTSSGRFSKPCRFARLILFAKAWSPSPGLQAAQHAVECMRTPGEANACASNICLLEIQHYHNGKQRLMLAHPAASWAVQRKSFKLLIDQIKCVRSPAWKNAPFSWNYAETH